MSLYCAVQSEFARMRGITTVCLVYSLVIERALFFMSHLVKMSALISITVNGLTSASDIGQQSDEREPADYADFATEIQSIFKQTLASCRVCLWRVNLDERFTSGSA